MDKKIVLIGAGSVMFGPSTMTDIFLSNVLDGATIMLHDINEEKLEIMYELMSAENEYRNNKVILKRSTNRAEALNKADFVINSITVGDRFKLWWQDFEIPRKHGSKQIMGECGGPGGAFQAFRNIPEILEIAEDVYKICPDALFINYSNPLPRINLAIKRVLPNLQCVGLCHQIALFTHHLPKMFNTPLEDLKLTVVGLNHFGFLMDLKNVKTDQDLMPVFNSNAFDYFRANEYKWEFSNLTFEIFKRYGYFPHPGDNHIGEYLQFAWEFTKPQEDYITRDEQAGIGIYNRIMKKYNQLKEGKFPRKGILPKVSLGERAISIIESVIEDKNLYENSVNVPNDGLITNLPQDLIVEVPGLVNRDGVQGIKYGDLPKSIAALMRIEASVQDLCVEAVLQESRDIALQCLTIDPNVGNAEIAESIFNEMVALQKEYLGYFN